MPGQQGMPEGIPGQHVRTAAEHYRRDAVDIVVNTHLHIDHVGWNTRLDGRSWAPTFPNATYLR
ncbi:hypothetical protein GCM10010341_56530 [Streptomyces noursei]|nr:hypothetical protein GCM10010341_56530 [Streptomyces noursei]